MKDKKKILGWVILFLACLCAVLSVIRKDQRRMRSSVTHAVKPMPRLNPKNVSSIVLSWKNVHTTLVRTPDGWIVKERYGHPADVRKIAKFLSSLSELRPLRVVDARDPETVSKLRVSSSAKERIPGVRVIVNGVRENGKSIFVPLDIVMGLGYFIRTDKTPVSYDRVPDGRYFGLYVSNGKNVRKDGSPVVFLSSSVFGTEHPIPGAWIAMPDLSVVSVARELKFTLGDMTIWNLKRDSDSRPFADASVAKLPVDERALQMIMSMFSGRWLVDVHPEKGTPFHPEGVFEVSTDPESGIVFSAVLSRFPKKGKNALLLRFSSKTLPGAPESLKKISGRFNASVRGRLYELGPREFAVLCKSPLILPRGQTEKK